MASDIGRTQQIDLVATVGQHGRSTNGVGGCAQIQRLDVQRGTHCLRDVASDTPNGGGVVTHDQSAVNRVDIGQLQIAGAANGDRRSSVAGGSDRAAQGDRSGIRAVMPSKGDGATLVSTPHGRGRTTRGVDRACRLDDALAAQGNIGTARGHTARVDVVRGQVQRAACGGDGDSTKGVFNAARQRQATGGVVEYEILARRRGVAVQEERAQLAHLVGTGERDGTGGRGRTRRRRRPHIGQTRQGTRGHQLAAGLGDGIVRRQLDATGTRRDIGSQIDIPVADGRGSTLARLQGDKTLIVNRLGGERSVDVGVTARRHGDTVGTRGHAATDGNVSVRAGFHHHRTGGGDRSRGGHCTNSGINQYAVVASIDLASNRDRTVPVVVAHGNSARRVQRTTCARGDVTVIGRQADATRASRNGTLDAGSGAVTFGIRQDRHTLASCIGTDRGAAVHIRVTTPRDGHVAALADNIARNGQLVAAEREVTPCFQVGHVAEGVVTSIQGNGAGDLATDLWDTFDTTRLGQVTRDHLFGQSHRDVASRCATGGDLGYGGEVL